MEMRTLGRTGLRVSVLGFGAAEIGFEKASLADVRKLLHGALDAGLNVLDTAAMYLDSEALIGQAVAARRKDFLLFTKCGHPAHGEEAFGPSRLRTDVQCSLINLRTDYVDLLQLHTCSEEVLRRGDALAVLEKAKQEGKARFLGYSGDGAAAAYALACGSFDVLQTSVNVVDQEALDHNLPEAARLNVGVIAKRPIANAVWRYPTKPDNWYVQTYWDRLRGLDYPSLRDPAAAAETAMRFTLGCPGVSTLIVGTKTPGRWQANAALVAKGPLPAEAFEAIRERWKAVAPPDWVAQA